MTDFELEPGVKSKQKFGNHDTTYNAAHTFDPWSSSVLSQHSRPQEGSIGHLDTGHLTLNWDQVEWGEEVEHRMAKNILDLRHWPPWLHPLWSTLDDGSTCTSHTTASSKGRSNIWHLAHLETGTIRQHLQHLSSRLFIRRTSYHGTSCRHQEHTSTSLTLLTHSPLSFVRVMAALESPLSSTSTK